jgi:hypothetical protein
VSVGVVAAFMLAFVIGFVLGVFAADGDVF